MVHAEKSASVSTLKAPAIGTRPESAAALREIPRPLSVSIVIPVYNEHANVDALVEQLSQVLDRSPRPVEVLLIDDGSTDGTVEKLLEIPQRDPRFRIIIFRRNFGQTAAMSAGFDYAQGDVIVAMDGDLQNDPADLELLLGRIERDGYDIVSGWRKDRKDSLISRKLPSWIANWLIGKITGVRLHDYGCSLKAYRSEVLKNVRLYGEMHRFIPALASWGGAKITEVPVRHRARTGGVSKYGIGRTVRVLLDLMTVKFLLTFSTRPLQVFGLWGLGLFGVGSVVCLYLAVLKLFFNQGLADRPLLMLGVLMVLMGVQLISMGLLAEITVRTYHESQSKPTYVIREIRERSSPGGASA
jgi:glycosyltransferase involved in cell wall biosynthesis